MYKARYCFEDEVRKYISGLTFQALIYKQLRWHFAAAS